MGQQGYLYRNYQTTIFKLVQIESICRRQYKCDRKIEISFEKGRKHCGKSRKCWVPAYTCPAMFSKGSVSGL